MEQAPEAMTLKVIAHIHTDFPTKFGIPRQSGLVDSLRGEVIFTPEYRNPDAVRGLQDFSHIWLVWQFSGAVREGWSPTVRPPRLGGNTRMGVFATRSPFRPNPLGLSSVRLEKIELRPELGPVLCVRGADLMDGTPIYDIKPYLPYADSHPDAAGGFTVQTQGHRLRVECAPALWAQIPPEQRGALEEVLANDPRPSYQHDPARIYGMAFGGLEIRFTVDGGQLTVQDVHTR
ncbi:MAG: tRNA (N6-threonylcarbamoyladenosine(37)-N6)-methyltransferase TrmO [Faecalibacterium sp.]